MESLIASLIGTVVFLIAAVVVGYLLGKSGKPYGAVKSVLHIALFVLISSGLIASIYKANGLPPDARYLALPLYVMALMLLANLVVGTKMLLIKRSDRKLIAIHKTSTSIMALSLVVSIVLVAFAIQR